MDLLPNNQPIKESLSNDELVALIDFYCDSPPTKPIEDDINENINKKE